MRKRVSHFYFLKTPRPLFISCETYPPLEVSMGEKMKEKRKNLAGGLPQIRLHSWGVTLLIFLNYSLKKTETHFCLLETPEERELVNYVSTFCFFIGHAVHPKGQCDGREKDSKLGHKPTLPRKVLTR
jgi:hypothetical protein